MSGAFLSISSTMGPEDRYRDGVPIATPRPDTVEHLHGIHHELLAPLRIFQRLRAPVVITTVPGRALRDAVREMAQLPVYEDGTYLALLTTNAVARWLAAQISDAGEGFYWTVYGCGRYSTMSNRPRRSSTSCRSPRSSTGSAVTA